jgi:hypothetical protein
MDAFLGSVTTYWVLWTPLTHPRPIVQGLTRMNLHTGDLPCHAGDSCLAKIFGKEIHSGLLAGNQLGHFYQMEPQRSDKPDTWLK